MNAQRLRRVVLFEAGCDGSEMLELIEEALDEVAVAVKEWAEGRDVLAVWHRLDVGPGPAQGIAQPVAVVSAIGQRDLPVADAAEHVDGTASVMGLALGQLQQDRQAVGVDKRMDLGGQSASRAPHASGVRLVPKGGVRFRGTPFLTLAAC